MDDLLLFLSEEIALEGDAGCNLPKLWSLVDNFYTRATQPPTHSTSTDDNLKRFLWPAIANMTDLTVTLSDPSEHSKPPKKSTAAKKDKKLKEDKAIAPKSNVQASIASTPPSELEVTYGNRLRLVSSEEAQKNALLGQMDVNYIPSPTLMRVLASVARTRSVGTTQADMSKELGIDPRSLFHFVKTLCAKGLITKFPVVTKGFYTNLCIHMRYAPQNAAYMATQATIASAKSSQQTNPLMSSTASNDPVVPSLNASSVSLSALESLDTTFFAGNSDFNVHQVSFHGELIRQKISDLLSASKTKIMVVEDLIDVVFGSNPSKKQRKWFNRTIGDMADKNFLERVNVPKLTRGIDRCVRLLKPFVPKSEMKHEEEDKDDIISDPENSDDEAGVSNQTDSISSFPKNRRQGLLADLPVEYQVYRLISMAGPSGITAGQIQSRLSNIYSRLLTKILTRLLKPPAAVGCSLLGVNRIAEFHGRERRYRYYLSNHFEAIQKQHGFSLVEDEGDVHETESQPAPNASIGKRRGSSEKISNLELSESSTPAPSTPVKPRGKEWKTPAYNQPNIAAHGDEYVQLFSNVNVTPRQQRGQRVRGSDDEDSEPTTGRSSKRKARENLRKCVSHVLDETDDNENVMDDKSTDVDVDVDVEVEVETEDNTTCSVCNSPNDEELLLLCDGCEVAQHTYCAKPRLQTIPEGNWYCNGPNCKNPAADDTADGCDIVMEDAFRSSPPDDSLALPSSHGATREITTEAEVPFSPDPGTHMTFTVMKRGAGKQAEIEVSPKSRRQMALHHQTAVQNNFDRIINGAGKSAAKTRKDGKQIIHNYNRSSITALQRKKILLQLLDEQQVVEVGYQLIRDYQECFKARYPEDVGKSTIDKKTFIRSANALEEDGLLRQYTIKMPLIHGGYTTKNLFLHRDLTPQSPEVKEYVMSIQDKALLVGGSYKPVKAPEVEQVEVERLNDLKYRLTNTMEGEHGPTATTSEISPPSPPKTLPSRGHPANPEFWMYAAQDFGWIPAKMIRAKLLHQWIASRFFDQNNKNEQESHGELQRRSFQSTLLFHDMPLEIYFQCIGHTQVNEELLEWVRKCPNPRQVKLIQLPNEIRQHIFSGNYKYRRNVKSLIDILVALNVISPVWRDYETSQQASSHQMTITASTEALAPSYLLQPTVPMYDYSRPRCATTGNRVFIRNYSLETISDVSIFWSELQFVSQQSVTEATRQGDSDEEDGEGLSDSERSAPKSKTGQKNSIAKLSLQDPLRCINAPRNWYSLYPFTTAQRRSLEEHVNRRTGKTPLDDEEIIKDLARKLEVIPFRVRNYFRKIESEYEKKAQNIKEKRNLMVLETERKKRAARTEGETADAEEGPHGDIRRRRRKNLSRRLRASADAARGTVPRLAPAPTPAGTKRKRLEDDMPSSWGRKSQRRNSREGADDELLVCGEEERFRNQYEPISSVRRPRLSWSEEEDEKIIHAYVVLKIRARHSLRFAWSPAASMIPGRTPDNCRRRLTTMLKRPAVAARVELLMIHWEALRANMLATGELSEPPAHVAMDAETLKLHMKHLVDRSGKNMPSRPLAMLPSLKIPSTVADFYAYADYAYALPFDDEVFVEDGIESLPSSRAKIQTLYSYAFGLRAYLGDGAADTPVSEMEEGKTVSWVNRKIVKEVVKMILMTPEGRYDPTRAYQILARYPFADSTTGLEEAKEDGCIVKVRSGVGIDRRVPGRGYHVSDKFLTIMSGILPNRLLPRAAAYHERLVRQLSQENVGASCAEPRTELSPLITDGGMACWLNLMAARKIHAIPVFPGFEEQNLVPGNASRQVDRRKLDCKIFTSPQRDLGETLSREISTTLLSGLPHLLSAASIGSQKGTLSERRKEELDCLRRLIEEAGSEGATLAHLLEKMSRSYPNISAQEVRLYVSLLLTKPAEESPNGTRNAPVITCGVSTKRFVSSKYVGLWWVQTNASPQDRLAPPTAMLATAGSLEPASALLADVYPRDEDVSMYSQPKMWFDISGNPVEPVLRGCMESLIGHVLTKPGISEANLYRKLSSVMSRLEMRDSLEELVVRRALRRTIMKRPERVSLFSKPRVYRIVGADEEIAEEERMSCYFVQENYYLKTSPIAS